MEEVAVEREVWGSLLRLLLLAIWQKKDG